MKVTKAQAQSALMELRRRREARKPFVDDNYVQQARFVRDESRFISAKCTRRAGKSHGLAQKFFNKAKKYPGSLCPYIGLTRESSENIMWPIFKQLNEEQKIGAVLTVSDLEITLPNQAKIKLFGADQKGFIEKLRGPKYPIAAVDEAQAFKGHIETLIDDVLTPAVADYRDGQIILTGTPGPIPKGYFYDCSRGGNGFVVHEWTVYDNPYFHRPREFVADLFAKKKWTTATPTYRREWLGEWVADTDALVYKFNAERDVINEIPALSAREEWFYVLGVDLGYSPDPSAFVLSAFNRFDRHMYILETYTEHKLTVSDVAERIKYYLKRFPTCKVVADLGAQGKMIGEEIRQRYGIPILAAEKHGKSGFIEIMNSDMAAGLIKVTKEAAEELVPEWMNLIWDSEKEQRVEDGRYENHRADAALYSWRYNYNYAHENRPEVIERGSEREMELYWEEQDRRGATANDVDNDLYGTPEPGVYRGPRKAW